MNFSSKERDEKSQLGMGCGKDGKHDKKNIRTNQKQRILGPKNGQK